MQFLKDLFQILFFIVIGTISILTYLKAKKTLLQPLRTEIFKKQLRDFANILKLCVGKTEHDLRNDFAFSKLIFANSCSLLDEYARLFFDLKIKREDRPYNKHDFPLARITKEALKTKFTLCNGYMQEAEKPKESEKPDSQIKAAIWSKYRYDIIFLPKEFYQKEEQFHKIMESPLLPKNCLSLLRDNQLS